MKLFEKNSDERWEELEEKIKYLKKQEGANCTFLVSVYEGYKKQDKRAIEMDLRWLQKDFNWVASYDPKTTVLLIFHSVLQEDFFLEEVEKIKVAKILLVGNHERKIKEEKLETIKIKDKLIWSKVGKNCKTLIPIIDLEQLDGKKYFYTEMRVTLEKIFDNLLQCNGRELKENPDAFCKKCIQNHEDFTISSFWQVPAFFFSLKQLFSILNFLKNEKKQDEIIMRDVEIIRISQSVLSKEEKFLIVKIQELIKALNFSVLEERYRFIYERICEELQQELEDMNYCDFQNNSCIYQRNKNRFVYPYGMENGCCYNHGHNCKQWSVGGACKVNCMACKLFTCKYLRERGITHTTYQYPLLDCFFNKKQRVYLNLKFFAEEDKIVKKLLKK